VDVIAVVARARDLPTLTTAWASSLGRYLCREGAAIDRSTRLSSRFLYYIISTKMRLSEVIGSEVFTSLGETVVSLTRIQSLGANAHDLPIKRIHVFL
jgi:hypothetical protein